MLDMGCAAQAYVMTKSNTTAAKQSNIQDVKARTGASKAPERAMPGYEEPQWGAAPKR